MNTWVLGIIGVMFLAVGMVAVSNGTIGGSDSLTAGGGFDTYGYNRTARIFNGTGESWCLAGGQPATCMDIYSPDKLIMKWTSDWDRGNAENWSKPPYDKAWLDNEWNGVGIVNGSGAVWHSKIKWVGTCISDGLRFADGGYCIWGQFEVVMDQGMDPNQGPGHLWLAKAKAAGYGTK